MENQQIRQINRYINIVLRRKVLILFCILSGVSLGLGYYLTQPKVYRSTTLLSYQQQRINPSQMSPDEEEQIRDIVSTLSQIVLSRTSLEQIIQDNKVFEGQRAQALAMEDKVQSVRDRVEITPDRRGDTFQISYRGGNPEIVVRVTNALAARFIEENLKFREQRASETSAYTQDELEMAKEMLDRKEAVMRDYKLQHYNEMPEQRESNVARLNALQEQYQSRQDSILDLERTRVLVQDQISVRKKVLEANERARLAQTTQAEPNVPQETPRERLTRLQAELQTLLGKYTEKHPEVKRLKRTIATLEEKIASFTPADKSSTTTEGAPDNEFDQGPVRPADSTQGYRTEYRTVEPGKKRTHGKYQAV